MQRQFFENDNYARIHIPETKYNTKQINIFLIYMVKHLNYATHLDF